MRGPQRTTAPVTMASSASDAEGSTGRWGLDGDTPDTSRDPMILSRLGQPVFFAQGMTSADKGTIGPVPPSSLHATSTMKANRRRDTKPELIIRSLLHRRGLRFRVDRPIRTGSGLVRPDIVFTAGRLAVFVDGCYWHACPEHG